MAENRELQIIISLKDQVTKALSAINKDLGGFGKSMQGAGKDIALVGASLTAAGVGVGFVAKRFVDAAAEFEQSKIAFTTLLGSADKATQLLADLMDFAKRTPFELKGLQTATKQLLAYGFTQDEVIPNLKALGDIASGVGMDKLPNLILAFGQVKAATKLTGMELRQFTEAGVPLLDELSNVLGVSVASVQEMITDGRVGFPLVQEALMNLTGEGGRFSNMMESQSRTFSGMISNLADGINIFLTQGGKPLMDFLKQFLEGMIVAVTKLNEWASAHPGLVKAIGIATAAIAAILVVLGTIITVIGLVVAAIGTILVAFVTLSGVAAALGISIGALIGIIALVPLAIAAVVAAIGVAVYMIITHWDSIKQFTIETWNFIVDFIKSHWEAIVNFLLPGIGALVVYVVKNWNSIKDATVNAWTGISNFFSSIWNTIKNTFTSAIDWIMNKLRPLLNAIDRVESAGKSIGGGISGAVKSLGKAIGVNDAIIAPNGNIITTHPDDYLIATKNPHSLGGGGITINITGNTLLDDHAAEKIGDMILNQVKFNYRLG